MVVPILNLPQIRPVSESIARAEQSNLTSVQAQGLQQQQQQQQETFNQNKTLQALKVKGLQDPKARAIAMQLDPSYGKQLQDFQAQQQDFEAKRSVYWGSQAQAATTAPLASRPAIYNNLYSKAKNADEDVSAFPLPSEKWTDAHQGTLDFISQSSVPAKNALEMKQRQAEQENKFKMQSTKNPGGATGELIDRYMKSTGSSFPDSLAAVQGLARKGLQYDEQGNVVNRAGFTESQEGLEAAKAKGKAGGKLTAETLDSYKSQLSKLPELHRTVGELGKLSDVATYTKVGLGRDALLRQTGRGMSEGGIARAKYIAMVDNQILPLLRDTFGAAFTVEEGKSLRATLGDPNASPEEKKAKLDAFIKQKMVTLESTGRKLGYKKEGGKISSDNNDPLGIR